MRDYVLILTILGAIPFALFRPIYGIYLWTWVSLMNPHRLTWGVAFNLPFAMFAAVATLIGLVLTKDARRWPVAAPTIVLAIFMVWITLGFPFSLFPGESDEMWRRVLKIQVMTLVAASLIQKREHVKYLAWVIALSLGFFGVKGGIFTIRGGGAYRVWGPDGSFIEGNNELALALIIVIPLMWYLIEITANRWIKAGLTAAIALSAIAVLGSYSRGALVAIVAMSITFWYYSKRKGWIALGLLLFWPVLLAFMPATWDQRMSSISSYQSDSSAMGRINAWKMAWNLAQDHPLFGGGFSIYKRAVFDRYAPVPDDVHAAHSIYFQVLGEHGFVGLFLFLMLWWFTWRTAIWIRRNTSARGDNAWAYHLAAMSQVSLVGYFVGGAFLSLAYFDLPYYVMVLLVATKWILKDDARRSPAKASLDRTSPNFEGESLVENAARISGRQV